MIWTYGIQKKYGIFKDFNQKRNMTLLMKKGMCFIKYYVEDDKY